MDVCIDCVQFLASGGRTGPKHQPEWSLAAIAARWGPEWVDKEVYCSWSPCKMCGSASFGPRFLCVAWSVSRTIAGSKASWWRCSLTTALPAALESDPPHDGEFRLLASRGTHMTRKGRHAIQIQV